MSDRSIYRTIRDESLPDQLEISFVMRGERRTVTYRKVHWTVDGREQGLRYGENPDQDAALYRPVAGNLELGGFRLAGPDDALVSAVELLQSGKHPGKINLTDADAAIGILRYLQQRPTCVIVKHNNPCGVASADTPGDAFTRALDADRIAAFGGAIALNRTIDREVAEAIVEHYAEVVVAPEFESAALEVFGQRRNLRVFRVPGMADLSRFGPLRYLDFRSLIDGGVIAQLSFVPRDLTDETIHPAQTEHDGRRYAIERAPTDAERRDMRFGWFVESGVTSNSVLYVKDETTVAIGTGEQDRVGVARIARDKAFWKYADRLARDLAGCSIEQLPVEEQERLVRLARTDHGGLAGATMVSDAFFPFADGAEIGLREGVSAIVQPGGALRDHEVIETVNSYGATMVFTGQRSFRH